MTQQCSSASGTGLEALHEYIVGIIADELLLSLH